MLRFEDGLINLQELIRRLAGDVANVVIAAEAEQLCGETGNSRNGPGSRGWKRVLSIDVVDTESHDSRLAFL